MIAIGRIYDLFDSGCNKILFFLGIQSAHKVKKL